MPSPVTGSASAAASPTRAQRGPAIVARASGVLVGERDRVGLAHAAGRERGREASARPRRRGGRGARAWAPRRAARRCRPRRGPAAGRPTGSRRGPGVKRTSIGASPSASQPPAISSRPVAVGAEEACGGRGCRAVRADDHVVALPLAAGGAQAALARRPPPRARRGGRAPALDRAPQQPRVELAAGATSTGESRRTSTQAPRRSRSGTPRRGGRAGGRPAGAGGSSARRQASARRRRASRAGATRRTGWRRHPPRASSCARRLPAGPPPTIATLIGSTVAAAAAAAQGPRPPRFARRRGRTVGFRRSPMTSTKLKNRPSRSHAAAAAPRRGRAPGAERPQIKVDEVMLSNGMRFLLFEQHDSPTVAAGWVAHVGSVNERPGITGISHLFEHMMFKGTKTIGTRDNATRPRADRRSRRRSGTRCATEMAVMREQLRRGEIADLTSPRAGRRGYKELEAQFDAARRRSSGTIIVKDEFDQIYTDERRRGPERLHQRGPDRLLHQRPAEQAGAVVLDGVRPAARTPSSASSTPSATWSSRSAGMRIESTPPGKFEEAFDAMFWDAHPLLLAGRRLAVRHRDDHARSRPTDYFATYYAPNNLTGVLVGDFKPAEVRRSLERYFGRIPRGQRSRRRGGHRSSRSSSARSAIDAEAETNPEVRICVAHGAVRPQGHARPRPALPTCSTAAPAASTSRSCWAGRWRQASRGLVPRRSTAGTSSSGRGQGRRGARRRSRRRSTRRSRSSRARPVAERGAAEGQEPGAGRTRTGGLQSNFFRLPPAPALRRDWATGSTSTRRREAAGGDRRGHPARRRRSTSRPRTARGRLPAQGGRGAAEDPELAGLPAQAQAMAKQAAAQIAPRRTRRSSSRCSSRCQQRPARCRRR